MKILLVGSGGREHALALGLQADSACTSLHVAPGNPGIEKIATCHNVPVTNNAALVALAEELSIDLVVVGPEVPLVNGLADQLRAVGISVFGPSQAAAQLEGSKDFAKKVMQEAGVPTAQSFTCTTEEEIINALDAFGAPFVVKDDGLAAGKGVVVTESRDEALAHALSCQKVVIEEFLDGPEVSLFGISDGKSILAMQPAQDFKRAYDGDKGLNTGGMGAYSPLPWAPSNIVEEVHAHVLLPMIEAMAKRGTPFVGLLYAGLALTSKGIKVIEFNARFGDPETEVLIPRLKTPLATLLKAAADGNLRDMKLEWRNESAVTVVLASQGYPADVTVGLPISNLNENQSSSIYHAGTKSVDGELCSSGGRVFAVTGLGVNLAEAREHAYRTISTIELSGSFYRSDIALKASISELEAK
jgi:phosphoribosylamine--glycine ligase